MKLADALQIKALRRAQVVAGETRLEREVRWAHVVDLPDPAPWVQAGMLLLTTGYAWPRDDTGQRALIRSLARKHLAGVCLAVPQFFEHFPTAARQEADKAGLPLIEIPWAIPFAQITAELHRAILDEQYRVIEQSESIHRELTRSALGAASLQDLAQSLGRLIGRAVTFEDLEGHLLASHRLRKMEDHIRQATIEHGQSPPEYAAFLEESGYTRAILASEGPMRIPAPPHNGVAGRVVCPIRIQQELVGLVWIIEGDSPLSELDLRAAEHAAVIAALHIAHRRELSILEARLGYTFLDSLLEGRFEPTPQALERAQLLDFGPQGAYRVGLLVLHIPLPLSRDGFLRREQIAARLARRLKEIHSPPLLSVSLNHVPFLLADGCSGEDVWEALAADDISMAISLPHVGAVGVRQGYDEVSSMVPVLQPGSFSRYEALLLPRVLSGDKDAQGRFLERLFGPLYGVRNGAMLKETLIAYAQSGFYLKRAAQGLSIHPKTLRYRLERVADLCKLDLDDPDMRFRLQLAAHILSLRDKNGA